MDDFLIYTLLTLTTPTWTTPPKLVMVADFDAAIRCDHALAELAKIGVKGVCIESHDNFDTLFFERVNQ